MSQFEVCLLGRFMIRCEQQEVACFQAQKVQELFSFLVLHRDKAHHRDQLADLLWGDIQSADNKKYLRKTLWKLKSELKVLSCSLERNLQIEPQWIRLHVGEDCWADVVEFEQAYVATRGIRDADLTTEQFQRLKDAVGLYRGDLLDGWYWGWCILERERFREMLLIMYNKLMGYCEVHADYEAGIGYGTEILRFDQAHERTHRRLMRLYDLSGNRSKALRQYERCRAALQEELDVEPGERTKALYRRIAGDASRNSQDESVEEGSIESLAVSLEKVKQSLAEHIQQQGELSRQIQALEEALRRRS